MKSMIGPVAVVGVLCGIAAPGPAWASDEAANSLIQEGNKHFRHEEYDAALEAFEQAFLLDPQSRTLLSIALAELRTNKPAEAAADFRRYLAKPDAVEDARTEIRTKWLPQAEAKLARVKLEMPAGAQVSIDGHPAKQDTSLGWFEVVGGDHDLVVEAGGHSQSFHLTVTAGSRFAVRALLDDPAPPPAMQNVVPDEPPPAAPATSGAKVATVVSLGIGALAGMGLGIGFDLAASAKASDIRGGEGCLAGAPTSYQCRRENYDVSVEHRDEWVSIGSYVGAGVLGAAAIATWFVWPRSPVHVGATLEPHEVGFGVTGRW